MSNEEWKYKLSMEESCDSWKFSRTMHFTDLKSAFFTLADFNLDGYSSNARHLSIPQITNVSISDNKGVNKLLVQNDSKEIDQDRVKVPGQFYIFPGGVESFEQEAGLSISHFKGYSPKHNYLLSAYILQETNDILLASTGLKLMRESIPAFTREHLPFQLSFNNKLFVNDGKMKSPQLTNVTNQDIFYHKDIFAAFYTMLNIDYDRMKKNLAWDKNLNGYFSGIHLSEVKPDGKGNKTFSAVNYQHTTYYHPKGKTDINGVVLSVHSSYLDRIKLNPLKPVVPDFESRRLLAQMNDRLNKMEPVNGLRLLLESYKNKVEFIRQVKRYPPSRRVLSVQNRKGKNI
jgi:hypothetical protein